MKNTLTPHAWPQIVKGVAILMVIAIHLMAPIVTNWQIFQQTPTLWHIANLINSFSRSSVPLFVMISGAFLLKKQEPIFVFLQKRVQRVFLPWIIAVGALVLIEQSDVITTIWTGFWFVPMILGLYCCTPILRLGIQYYSERTVFWITTLLLAGTLILWKNATTIFIFEYLGYYLAGHAIVQYLQTKKAPAAMQKFALPIYIACSIAIAIHTHMLSKNAGVFVDHAYSFISPWTMFAGISLVYWLASQAQKLQKQSQTLYMRPLIWLGNWSFEIYLGHILFLRLLQYPT